MTINIRHLLVLAILFASPLMTRVDPVASNIPTLLVSGTLDTLTSLAGAKAAAARLSRATIISIPGVGHTVSPWSSCTQKIIVSFYADPNVVPDTSCVAAYSAGILQGRGERPQTP